MTPATTRTLAALAAAALLISACNDTDNNDPADDATPPPSNDDAANDDAVNEPDPVGLDEDIAASLLVARFEAVYGLPPTPADQLDIDAAGEGIVAPDSLEAERLAGVLTQARERGVIDRGDVRAEALEAPATTGDDEARATLCMSQDVRTTQLDTGEEVSEAPAPPDVWLRVEANYVQLDGQWLISETAAATPAECVPTSIEDAVTESWETFTAAWREWERTGGDADELVDLVTEDHAAILQSLPSFNPVDDPAPQTDLVLHRATRSRVEADWCRLGKLEEGIWQLVDGVWLVSDAGQFGTEPKEDPRCT
jgi:hypothetical protein